MPTIQNRRATAAQWIAANPVLAPGEIGFELDSNAIKIGDGLTVWADLRYLSDESLSELVATGRLSEAALNGTYGAEAWHEGATDLRQTVDGIYGTPAPSITPYEALAIHNRVPLFQDGTTVYAQSVYTDPRTIYKSTDRGKTWMAKGKTTNTTEHFIRVPATGTLICVARSGDVERSTDDGMTWTTVHTSKDGPLTPPIDTPSGNVVWGEYGNGKGGTYTIWVSTDDGLTWQSRLESAESPTDDRHWHGVYWDPYEACLVAQHDQQDFPHHYRSDDEGLTWTLIRAVSDRTMDPDWVTPMFFENYIAWGYDNRRNGVIARMKREDYYSGNWEGNVETVAQLNHKVFYGAIPVRPGVWMVAQASESISRDPNIGQGAWSQEVHIVSDDGGLVSGGIEYITSGNTVFNQDNHKALFPQVPHHAVTVGVQGDTWIAFHVGYLPGTATMLPISAGWNRGTRLLSPATGMLSPVIKQGDSLYTVDSGGTNRATLRMQHDGEVRLTGRYDTSSIMQLRLGTAARIVRGGVNMASFTVNGLDMHGQPIMLSGYLSPSIRAGSGSPEASVGARPGSLYADTETGTIYRKNATGDRGWVELSPARTSAQLSSRLDSVNRGKFKGMPAFDTTLNRPVWASGAGDTDTWVDAMGEVVHTPT